MFPSTRAPMMVVFAAERPGCDVQANSEPDALPGSNPFA